MSLKASILAAVFVCGTAVSPLTAAAMPVDVAYTVSGSPGNWTLDFSFTNNLIPAPADMSLYILGVETSAPGIVGSPADFDPNSFSTWNNATLGGSSTIYNNVWHNPNYDTLFPGTSLSGFQVHVADETTPTGVAWFVLGYSRSVGEYTGGGNFFTNTIPGFEGVAHIQPVPLPATFMLFGSGLISIMRWQRKRLHKSA